MRHGHLARSQGCTPSPNVSFWWFSFRKFRPVLWTWLCSYPLLSFSSHFCTFGIIFSWPRAAGGQHNSPEFSNFWWIFQNLLHMAPILMKICMVIGNDERITNWCRWALYEAYSAGNEVLHLHGKQHKKRKKSKKFVCAVKEGTF